jgi:hypothetical protein
MMTFSILFVLKPPHKKKHYYYSFKIFLEVSLLEVTQQKRRQKMYSSKQTNLQFEYNVDTTQVFIYFAAGHEICDLGCEIATQELSLCLSMSECFFFLSIIRY